MWSVRLTVRHLGHGQSPETDRGGELDAKSMKYLEAMPTFREGDMAPSVKLGVSENISFSHEVYEKSLKTVAPSSNVTVDALLTALNLVRRLSSNDGSPKMQRASKWRSCMHHSWSAMRLWMFVAHSTIPLLGSVSTSSSIFAGTWNSSAISAGRFARASAQLYWLILFHPPVSTNRKLGMLPVTRTITSRHNSTLGAGSRPKSVTSGNRTEDILVVLNAVSASNDDFLQRWEKEVTTDVQFS